MPSESSEATSPATTAPAVQKSDAQVATPGNLSMGQAAAQLFAKVEKVEPQEPIHQVTEEKAPEKSETAPETPVTEAEAASAETEPEETPASETTETTTEEGATEGEDDDVLSPKTSLDQKTKDKIQKRIDKEVGKRKALEALITERETKLTTLEAKLNEIAQSQQQPAAPVVVMGDQPLANIQDFQGLGLLQQQAKEAIRWAEEQLDRDDLGDGVQVGNEVYDRAKLKGIMRKARVTLEDHIPMRAQFLTAQHQAQQAAYVEFPALKDRSSPDYQYAQQARRDYPWLNSIPNSDWIIGVQIRGIKALEADKAAAKLEAEAKAKPKAKPVAAKPSSDQTTAPVSTTATRVPVQTAARQQELAEKAKFKAKGAVTAAEAAAFLQRKELIRNSR